MELRLGILYIKDAMGAENKRREYTELLLKKLGRVEKQVSLTASPQLTEEISETLKCWTDQEQLDVIFTSGGIGFGLFDVVPEATKAVIERSAPGLVHSMLSGCLVYNPQSALFRPVAGVRRNTIILNLPGSKKDLYVCFDVVYPVIAVAVESTRKIKDKPSQSIANQETKTSESQMKLKSRPDSVADKPNNLGNRPKINNSTPYDRATESNDNNRADDSIEDRPTDDGSTTESKDKTPAESITPPNDDNIKTAETRTNLQTESKLFKPVTKLRKPAIRSNVLQSRKPKVEEVRMLPVGMAGVVVDVLVGSVADFRIIHNGHKYRCQLDVDSSPEIDADFKKIVLRNNSMKIKVWTASLGVHLVELFVVDRAGLLDPLNVLDVLKFIGHNLSRVINPYMYNCSVEGLGSIAEQLKTSEVYNIMYLDSDTPDLMRVGVDFHRTDEILKTLIDIEQDHVSGSISPPGPVAPGAVVVAPHKGKLERAQVVRFNKQDATIEAQFLDHRVSAVVSFWSCYRLLPKYQINPVILRVKLANVSATGAHLDSKPFRTMCSELIKTDLVMEIISNDGIEPSVDIQFEDSQGHIRSVTEILCERGFLSPLEPDVVIESVLMVDKPSSIVSELSSEMENLDLSGCPLGQSTTKNTPEGGVPVEPRLTLINVPTVKSTHMSSFSDSSSARGLSVAKMLDLEDQVDQLSTTTEESGDDEMEAINSPVQTQPPISISSPSPAPPPISIRYCQFEERDLDDADVIILDVELGHVWLRRNEDAQFFTYLDNEILRISPTLRPVDPKQVVEGRAYIVREQTGSSRVVVTKILVESGAVEVFFPDLCRVDQAQTGDLFYIPASLQHFECHSFMLKMADFDLTPGRLSAAKRTLMEHGSAESRVVLKNVRGPLETVGDIDSSPRLYQGIIIFMGSVDSSFENILAEKKPSRLPAVHLLSSMGLGTRKRNQNAKVQPLTPPASPPTFEFDPDSTKIKVGFAKMPSEGLPFKGLITGISQSGVIWVLPEGRDKMHQKIQQARGLPIPDNHEIELGDIMMKKDRNSRVLITKELNRDIYQAMKIDSDGELIVVPRVNLLLAPDSISRINIIAIPLQIYGIGTIENGDKMDGGSLYQALVGVFPTMKCLVVPLPKLDAIQFPVQASVYMVGSSTETNLAFALVELGSYEWYTSCRAWRKEMEKGDLGIQGCGSVDFQTKPFPSMFPAQTKMFFLFRISAFGCLVDMDEIDLDTKDCDLLHISTNVEMADLPSLASYSGRHRERVLKDLERIKHFVDINTATVKEKLLLFEKKAGHKPKTKQWKKKDRVLALYVGDDAASTEWVRAEIRSIETEKEVANVFFTDYGHEGSVDIRSLRELDRAEWLEPPRSIGVRFMMPESVLKLRDVIKQLEDRTTSSNEPWIGRVKSLEHETGNMYIDIFSFKTAENGSQKLEKLV